MSRRQAAIAALLALTAVVGCGDDNPARPRSEQTRIVFVSFRTTINSSLWAMNADGTNQRQLTYDGFQNLQPSWSKDGSHVLYARRWQAGPATWRSAICRINGDGTSLTVIDSLTDTFYVAPRYSPDGTKIVCERDAGSRVEVWVLNADGSGAVNLTPAPDNGSNPDWSPDGSRIVYSRVTAAGWRLYTMNADGTDTLKLLETVIPNSHQSQPRWSPDGTTIVYTDDHGAASTGAQFAWIDIVNSDGTNPRPVTPTTDGLRAEPCWAPDGSRIAYREQYPDPDIVTIRPDGTDAVNVSHYPGHDITPDWGPRAP